MADALCGPSNALQTFQKQTSVDRTLQQDRIAVREAQTEVWHSQCLAREDRFDIDVLQNFRSLPGRNAGILDAEFEAFQAGPGLIEPGYPEQPFSNADPPTSYQPNIQQPQPGLPYWASDFQKLNLNEARASPIPHSQFHQHAPLQRHTPTGWHQDFLRQQNQSSPYQSQQHQRPAPGWLYGYSGGLMPQQDSMLSPIAQQKQRERQSDVIYDEAAFEKAFDAAGLNIEHSQHHQDQRDTQLDQDLYRMEDASKNLMSPETEAWLDHSRIGSDRIVDGAQERQPQEKEASDADELARTAGQLLENVKGDQSRKFQESNFLSLMRQLRDKEVRVEGDKLVDVSVPSASS